MQNATSPTSTITTTTSTTTAQRSNLTNALPQEANGSAKTVGGIVTESNGASSLAMQLRQRNSKIAAHPIDVQPLTDERSMWRRDTRTNEGLYRTRQQQRNSYTGIPMTDINRAHTSEDIHLDSVPYHRSNLTATTSKTDLSATGSAGVGPYLSDQLAALDNTQQPTSTLSSSLRNSLTSYQTVFLPINDLNNDTSTATMTNCNGDMRGRSSSAATNTNRSSMAKSPAIPIAMLDEADVFYNASTSFVTNSDNQTSAKKLAASYQEEQTSQMEHLMQTMSMSQHGAAADAQPHDEASSNERMSDLSRGNDDECVLIVDFEVHF